MAILKLKPPVKDYVWGGRRLIDEYNKTASGDTAAETWELSCYPGSESVIENGKYAGKILSEYIADRGNKVLGTDCRRFDHFPVLVKFIDAKEDLSIQVHPDDTYARDHGFQYGKSEMWYILDADEDAKICYGFREKISKEEFEQRIYDGTLTDVLNIVPVKKGDLFFIKAGTIHSIGKGILLAEVQQSSNVTYRVFDYKRKDKEGRERELHVDKALDVTRIEPAEEVRPGKYHLLDCPFFTVDRMDTLDGDSDTVKIDVDKGSFKHLLFTHGSGKLKCKNEEMEFKKGDSYFITAGSGTCEISGSFEVIISYV